MNQNFNLAIDYYKTPLTHKQIADKYNMTPSRAANIAQGYDLNLRKMPIEDKVVILVDRKDAEKASLILEGSNIRNHIPSKFHLTEEIESKINEE